MFGCYADWWDKNKEYWRIVRKEWDDLFSKKKELNFQASIDEQKRWERLFALQDHFTGNNAAGIEKN